MPDPRPVSVSNPASRYGITLDDTPEWSIRESLNEVTRELENYRSQMRDGDPAAANRAIDRAERRLPQAPAAAGAAPLRAAIAELRGYLRPDADAAASEIAGAQRNTGRNRRAPSLEVAVRAFARSGSARTLANHFGSTPRAITRRLASVDQAELKSQLVAAGATREQATEMLSRLRTTAAVRFHGMAVGQARIQVREAALAFRNVAQGHGLTEMATRMVGGEGTQVLDQMRAADIDMSDIDAALGSEDPDALAVALRPALRQLSSRLNELRTEIGQSSSYAGSLYINFPGAARVAADRAGLDPSVVDGRPDGSVLGAAIAEHAQDAREAQEGARTWLNRALLASALVGGLTAPIAVAVAAAEAHTTNSRGEQTNLAAAARLATSDEATEAAEAAEHSARNFVVDSAVAIGGEAAAHGVGHGLSHAAKPFLGRFFDSVFVPSGAIAEGLGHLAHTATEYGVHEGAHAVEHEVHDEGH